MNIRKVPLVNDEYYHIYSRSIAKYVIFNNDEEYYRLFELLRLCRFEDFNYRFSRFLELKPQIRKTIIYEIEKSSDKIVEIVAFCIMPTHLHLILKQKKDDGITKFMAKVLNSYSKFFNIKHGRKGPLWEANFKNIQVVTDEQLLHLSRYIHLNPTSAGLVKNPQDWEFSSFHEFIGKSRQEICDYRDVIGLSIEDYKKFVISHANDQKQLAIIKGLMIENYSG